MLFGIIEIALYLFIFGTILRKKIAILSDLLVLKGARRYFSSKTGYCCAQDRHEYGSLHDDRDFDFGLRRRINCELQLSSG